MPKFALLFTMALAGQTLCASPVLADDPKPAPVKVLILPAEMRVYSLTATNAIEDAPDATVVANTASDAEVRHFTAANPQFQPVAMPTLSSDEQAALKQHVALYKAVVGDVHIAERIGDAWKGPLDSFAYTVGPGLQFLKQRSNADYLLVLFGADGESTGGRIAMTLLFGGLTGQNYICAGLIDLDSGKIVWLNYDTHNAKDFKDPKNMASFVNDILQDYPDGSLHSYAYTAADASTNH
ncbi:MAG TPA: hypothetical protein VGT99_11085 [Gammaproteobacteria bacterium]|nr:hypothetical protein [Gammaproteobacteria bacterium]